MISPSQHPDVRIDALMSAYRRFTVILLTNRDDPPPYPLALAIAKRFL